MLITSRSDRNKMTEAALNWQTKSGRKWLRRSSSRIAVPCQSNHISCQFSMQARPQRALYSSMRSWQLLISMTRWFDSCRVGVAKGLRPDKSGRVFRGHGLVGLGTWSTCTRNSAEETWPGNTMAHLSPSPARWQHQWAVKCKAHT